MRCMFCEDKLFRPNTPPGGLVTLPPNSDVAHKECAQRAWVTRKTFGPMKIDAIPTEELNTLKELVLNEISNRNSVPVVFSETDNI